MIILIVVISLAVVGTTVGVTLAVWSESLYDNSEIVVNKDDYNPSQKYLVFAPLDEEGNYLESDSGATAYAVVGYGIGGGLVSEVIIPSTHNNLPVTKIGVQSGTNYQYRFNGNGIITSIIIPDSVTEIGVSVFGNMASLQTVKFLADGDTPSPVTIGDYAFAGCTALTTFTCTREIYGTRIYYLFGCPCA